MLHTFWTLYIALTKKKCKKGKCNEKVGFHYKLWIEVPSFQTCLDGIKLLQCWALEPFNQRFGYTMIEKKPLKTRIWICRGPKSDETWRFESLQDVKHAFFKGYVSQRNSLQICFGSNHQQKALKKCPGKIDNPFHKTPKNPKKSQFSSTVAITGTAPAFEPSLKYLPLWCSHAPKDWRQ